MFSKYNYISKVVLGNDISNHKQFEKASGWMHTITVIGLVPNRSQRVSSICFTLKNQILLLLLLIIIRNNNDHNNYHYYTTEWFLTLICLGKRIQYSDQMNARFYNYLVIVFNSLLFLYSKMIASYIYIITMESTTTLRNIIL